MSTNSSSPLWLGVSVVTTKLQKLIEIEKSLFSLPWIMGTVLFACLHTGLPLSSVPPATFSLIFIAFFSARVAGMSFNRLIDRFYDAENPRTRNRLLPSGEATPLQVALVGWMGIAGLLLSCFFLNRICLVLSPLAVLLLFGYSYAKRFTASCHLIMSFVHGLSLIFTWAAVTGGVDPVLLPLVVAIVASISGTDMIYGCQDVAYDRARGLHSMAVQYGVENTLMVAKALHLIAFLSLLFLGEPVGQKLLFAGAALLFAELFSKAHRNLTSDSLEEITPFFFRCNLLAGALVLGVFITAYCINMGNS